jgi:hypothetical protein
MELCSGNHIFYFTYLMYLMCCCVLGRSTGSFVLLCDIINAFTIMT